jgi:polysaccharide biosynthesis PFTS motif protein
MRRFSKFIFKLKFRLFLVKYLRVMRKRKKVKTDIEIIKSEIADIKYNFINYFINYIFKKLPIDFETFFNQYNLYRYIHTEKLNFSILKSDKLIYPLTNEQIAILNNHNHKVSYFMSKLFLILNCFIEFISGVCIFIFIIVKFIFNIITFKKLDKKYIFIKNYNTGQIRSLNNSTKSFKSWIENKLDIGNYNLVHNNPECKNYHTYNKFFLPELYKFSEIFKFIIFFLKVNILVFLDLLMMRSSQILIYSELIKLCCSMSKNKKSYENSYFLFNTNAFFRPLYSYRLGKNVFFFEYSTNNTGIYYTQKETRGTFTLKNLSWDNYIVWNEDQVNKIKNNQIINAKYYVFGPISFESSKKLSFNSVPQNSILVFDSIPFRRSFYSIYNFNPATYFDYNIIKFLNDIAKIDKKNSVFIKVKRNLDKKIYSKKYIGHLKKSNFILLDPEYDPEEVISKFEKIICLPFSSTANIAKKMNKKVCYYDVCGIHNDFDKIFKNIPIIRNFTELQKWSQN